MNECTHTIATISYPSTSWNIYKLRIIRENKVKNKDEFKMVSGVYTR